MNLKGEYNLRNNSLSEDVIIFVLGGYDNENNRLNDVELISLGRPDGSCSASAADHPTNVDGSTLAYLDGTISSCGGYPREMECYDYDVGSNTWTRTTDLSEEREMPSSSLIGDGGEDWLIAGGGDESDLGSATTEVRRDGVSTPGPSLPDGLWYACQITLNETHVFFADGHDGYTYILDYEEGRFYEQARGHTFIFFLSVL